MTDLPGEFPLPEDVFERQRSLLGASVASPQPTRRIRWRVVAIAAVVVVGGALAVPGLSVGSRLLHLIQVKPTIQDQLRWSALQGPVWSPDGGRTIAFLRPKDDVLGGAVYVVSVGGRSQRKLSPDSEYDSRPRWSPVGRQILVTRRRRGSPTVDIWVLNADGRGQRNLTSGTGSDDGDPYDDGDPAWSPDGRMIAFARDGIYVTNADGNGRRNLTPGLRSVAAPAWSPDGQRIAFTSSHQRGSGNLDIYVVNADGSGQRNLTPGPQFGGAPAWSPDGRRIFFTSSHERGSGNADIYVVNADGSAWRKLARGGATGSPDGRRIAFGRGSDDTLELYVMNADGSEQRRLTRNAAADWSPHWSPDSRKIAFLRGRPSKAEIYVMNADGSGQRNLTRNSASDGDLAWSPDGQTLTFISDRSGTSEVYVMNADGSRQRRLTQRRP